MHFAYGTRLAFRAPYLQYIQHFYRVRLIRRFQGVHDVPYPQYRQFVPFIHGK